MQDYEKLGAFYLGRLEQRGQDSATYAELQGEVDKIESGFDALSEPLEPVTIAPKSSDIHMDFVGLGWAPHNRDAQGRLVPAWI